MKENRLKLILLSLFAIAMAYLEAVVVIYLRELYYPARICEIFPLKIFTKFDYVIELGREFSTILMLAFVAFMVERLWLRRFFCFLYIFGMWDMFYYFWLWVTISWPKTFLDWDILFLIPLPWIAPWITPFIIALVFAIFGGYVIYQGFTPKLDPKSLAFILLGALIDFYTFIEQSLSLLLKSGKAGFYNFTPHGFLWWLYLTGLILMIMGFIRVLRTKK